MPVESPRTREAAGLASDQDRTNSIDEAVEFMERRACDKKRDLIPSFCRLHELDAFSRANSNVSRV